MGHAGGHVFDRDDGSNNAPVSAERTDGDVLLHARKAGDLVHWSTGDQVVMQGGGEDFDGAA